MAINIIGTMSEGPKKHFLTEISEVAQVMVWATISSRGNIHTNESVFLNQLIMDSHTKVTVTICNIT